MQRRTLLALTTALLSTALSSGALIGASSSANAAIACTAVKGTLAGKPGIKSVLSDIQAAAGANVAYCKVSILYGNSADQNINIVVGLPLNSLDGGTGGKVQGAWDGRTQGLGGGGCAGNLGVTAATNTRYVGSGTDGGHTGGDCEPGVNLDGTYNFGFLDDWTRVGLKQEILFSKSLANSYYGTAPVYNYWNGCSTGGRQGYLLAQELGNELDGILANAPAINWTRFQTAQMWGQIVMKDLVGGPISAAKLSQTSASAVAACDAADGVTDGIIDDPRTCTFSAKANICGAPTAPATNCLTAAEAAAIDKIWDGPRNLGSDNKIWFGLDRGTNLSGLNGTNPFGLGVTQFHWDEHDRNFDWHTVTMNGYAQVAQDGTTNRVVPGVSLAEETDTVGNLDDFKKRGGKLLTYVGGNDQLIMPRGVINYYRQMAARYGINSNVPGLPNVPNFANVQGFYRLFRAPGVAHCGLGNGSPDVFFAKLVAWVEQGTAPDQIIETLPTKPTASTRPLCPYPQTAIWNKTGSPPYTASDFHCGGNLETSTTVCADVLIKEGHEASSGQLDFTDTGVNRNICGLAGKSADAGK
jgi:Tannase and feruloyl esterase